MKKITRWLQSFFILLALGTSLAYATPPSPPPGTRLSRVNVDVPLKQPGVPANEFKLGIKLSDFEDDSKGTIAFTVESANNGDLNGVVIPSIAINAGKSESLVTAHPIFKKEGLYFLKVRFKTQSLDFFKYIQLLYIDDLVYYNEFDNGVVSVIASENLKSNTEHTGLLLKAKN